MHLSLPDTELRRYPIFDQRSHYLLRALDCAYEGQKLSMCLLGVTDPSWTSRGQQWEPFRVFRRIVHCSLFAFVAE